MVSPRTLRPRPPPEGVTIPWNAGFFVAERDVSCASQSEVASTTSGITSHPSNRRELLILVAPRLPPARLAASQQTGLRQRILEVRQLMPLVSDQGPEPTMRDDFKTNPIGVREERSVVVGRVLGVELRISSLETGLAQRPGRGINIRGTRDAEADVVEARAVGIVRRRSRSGRSDGVLGDRVEIVEVPFVVDGRRALAESE